MNPISENAIPFCSRPLKKICARKKRISVAKPIHNKVNQFQKRNSTEQHPRSGKELWKIARRVLILNKTKKLKPSKLKDILKEVKEDKMESDILKTARNNFVDTEETERRDFLETEPSKLPFNKKTTHSDPMYCKFVPKKGKNEKTGLKIRDRIKSELKGKLILLPDDKFKGAWNLIITFFIIYSIIVTPFRIAFSDSEPMGWTIADIIVDFFFATDIILSFFSAYYNHDHTLILDRKVISLAYIKSWFLIDIIAILPLSYFMGESFDVSNLSRMTRLTRLYRLLRVFKMARLMKVVKERSLITKYFSTIFKLNSAVQRIFFIIGSCLLLCHISACMWFLIAKMEDFDPETWVCRYGFIDSGTFEVYMVGFYWCITTITTVGYGDISAGTTSERIFCMLLMVIGVVYFSFAIGTLSSVLANFDKLQAILKHKFEILENLSLEYRLDTDFVMRLRKALKFQFKKNENEKFELLRDLPPKEQRELSTIINSEITSQFKFFRKLPQNIIMSLLPNIKYSKVSKGDYIFEEGESAECMYFLIKGEAQYVLLHHHDKPFINITKSEYFGDEDLFVFKRDGVNYRRFTVKALKDCELIVLKENDFLQSVEEFPKSESLKKLIEFSKIKKNKFLEFEQNAEFQAQNEDAKLLIQDIQSDSFEYSYQENDEVQPSSTQPTEISLNEESRLIISKFTQQLQNLNQVPFFPVSDDRKEVNSENSKNENNIENIDLKNPHLNFDLNNQEFAQLKRSIEPFVFVPSNNSQRNKAHSINEN